jgi:antitoxin (DNA-binding transcriptional repressor) of toxin-antitoxin stability system
MWPDAPCVTPMTSLLEVSWSCPPGELGGVLSSVEALVGENAGAHFPRFVLPLTHMKTIGVRELQQHASAALRRVEGGETLGVTDRGRLVAVLVPPSAATGTGALLASGRVQPASRRMADLAEPVAAARKVSRVLDELRADR